jgi:RNA polymerase sigma factor (sigma-70 family)
MERQNELSFNKLYHAHSVMVYNLVLNYLQNEADAEEVTQDVFVKVYDSMHTFKANSSVKTWIYRIAVNKSLDALKARTRKKRSAFVSFLFGGTEYELQEMHHFNHPGAILEQKENIAKLFQAIDQLPEQQKTALILSKFEQQNNTEISEIMDISLSAVESLVFRAKKNLKEKIAKNLIDEQETVNFIV